MKKLSIFVTAIFLTTNFSFAGDAIQPTGSQQPAEQPVQLAQAQSASGTITFSFKDADIRNVLRLIAAKSGVNIVYGPEVVGMVNMELRDVPWEQALSLILDLNGFAYQKTGNVVKVLKKEDVGKEPLSTAIFTLNYATAKDTVESVKQMLTERGSIKTDARSNTIVVTDVPVNINKIEEVLAKLDAQTSQVLLETKIVQMSDEKQKDLGIKWTSLAGYKIKIQDPRRALTDTFKTLRENTSTETWTLGDGWSGGGDYWAGSPRYGPDYTDPSTVAYTDPTVPYNWDQSWRHNVGSPWAGYLGTGNAQSNALLDIKSAILSADTFELLLSALQDQTDAQLISGPYILVANNEKALINVGSEYPIPNYTFDTSTSTFTISGFDYKNIGVIFEVVPSVSSDGYITMKIEPQVSKLEGEIPFTASGATVLIPLIGLKKASTKLIIKSGDTLVIGGLVSEEKENTTTKIPLLGDIPIFGRLFRHDSTKNVKKNVIFFITATVIDENTRNVIQMEGPPIEYEVPRQQKTYNKLFRPLPKADLVKETAIKKIGKVKTAVDKTAVKGNRGHIEK